MVVAVAAVVLSARRDDTPSAHPGPSTTDRVEGKHPWSQITNACDLLDRQAITRWVAEISTPPLQSVTLGPTSTAAAEMSCRYTNGEINGELQDTTAVLELRVELADATHDTSFARWKKLWIDDNSSEFEMTGPVPDLGGQAYYSHWRIDQRRIADIPPRQAVRHVLVVKDGNLAIEVNLELTLSNKPPADDQEVATAARRQLDKALAALRK
ncbi:hypothetical protein AB0C34_17805 [Nocardia sp. NPDC049220]|uniref:hypothetical protein n=1 Tax=Nocardia sp. NPDC049220 TaxID=3155273 RepID=UPI0033C58533